MKTASLILVATGTTTALVAGLFFAWSCSITVGLSRLPDATYIAAMQSINRAIQNPVFFAAFFGAAILLPITTASHYQTPLSYRFRFLLAATAIYSVGVIGITICGNVPLNDRLDTFPATTATPAQMAQMRASYERPWNNLNAVRAVASTLAVVFVLMACLSNESPQGKTHP